MGGLSQLSVVELRCFRGASAGLGGPTACFRLEIKGDAPRPESLRSLQGACKVLWGHLPPPYSHSEWFARALEQDGVEGDLHDWMAALTVALQWLAGDPVGKARVSREKGKTPCIAVPWVREDGLRGAMEWSLRLLLHWLRPVPPTREEETLLLEGLAGWVSQVEGGGLAPSSLRFALAALDRRIPMEVLGGGVIRLGWGHRYRFLESSFSGETPAVSARLARNKVLSCQLLSRGCLPIPRFGVASNQQEALAIAGRLKWPLVVKPSTEDQGRGVVLGLRDERSLLAAFQTAQAMSPGCVIVQQQVPGEDYRLLVVGGKLRMATQRHPACVIGDGHSTVRDLLDTLNSDPRRGTHVRSMLKRIPLDQEALTLLKEQALDASTVPEAGQKVQLRRIANISAGGTAEDVTAKVHPDNARLAERAAELLKLDIAGVDFLCPDISRSWQEVGGYLCEVNAQPGLRVHWLGCPERDINAEILDWMFAGDPMKGRIPIAGITGTNGKTTTSRMLQHMWRQEGKCTGLSCSIGVWIDHEVISKENLSGEPGGRVLLTHPQTEAAVIEMTRQGLLRFGHPCDTYDVSLLLNIQKDHIGSMGIETMEQMAVLKAELLERTTGAVVVNADDPLCLAMLPRALTRRHVLVARSRDNAALASHLASGGEGVYSKPIDGRSWLMLAWGTREEPLMPLGEIPATMGGLLSFNESNALHAAGMGLALGISPAAMRRALAGFSNTADCNPGRYNFIPGLPFQVMLDFAHNNDGQDELCRVVRELPCTGKKWLVTTKTANRHPENMDHCAPVYAKTFDHVVMSTDGKDVYATPGYQDGVNAAEFMLRRSRNLLEAAGMRPEHILTEANPGKAIQLGLASAQPGDLLVILADHWFALPMIEARR